MIGTSFTNQGATPNSSSSLFSPAPKLNANTLFNKPTSTPYASALNSAANPPAIKKQTVTEYHPPENQTGTFGGTAALPTSYSYNNGNVTPTNPTPGLISKSNPPVNTASPGLIGTTVTPQKNYDTNQTPTTPQVSTQSPYATMDHSDEAKQYRLNNPQQNTYGGLIQNLLDTSQNNTGVQNANKALLDFRQNYAKKVGDIETTPIPLEFQQGREQVLNKQAAVQESALTQNVSNALQGQSLQQNAAQQAAGFAAPIQAPYTNQVLNPLSGGSIQGGTNNAFTGGKIAGQYNLGQQTVAMNAANIAAKGIKNSVVSYLQQNPSLNPSDLSFANSIAQWAKGEQLGDPKYQTLANYLNEYISTLAPILGVGGDTTNLKTEIAKSMINAKAGSASIIEVLGNMEKLADDKLKNIESAGQGGGQVSNGTPTNTSGGTISAGGYNFKQDANGNWMPA